MTREEARRFMYQMKRWGEPWWTEEDVLKVYDDGCSLEEAIEFAYRTDRPSWIRLTYGWVLCLPDLMKTWFTKSYYKVER